MKRVFLYTRTFGFILAAFMLVFIHFLDNSDPRERYESFLTDHYLRYDELVGGTLNDPDNPGFPDLAALQNYFMTLDPGLGYVPAYRLEQAAREFRAGSGSSGLSGTGWENVPTHTGGRTRTVMFDPNDPLHQKLWAGAVTGGLWYNEDFTDTLSSWHPAGDLWPSLSVSCITHDPNDLQTFFVGTGEAQTAVKIYRESSGVGCGMFRSRDGGVTWELVTSTEDFRYITDIVVRDENGSSVVYAGVVSGIYQGEQHMSLPSDGLYRSDDDGESWTQVLPDIPWVFKPYAPSDIEITSGGRIFVGTMPNTMDRGGAIIFYSDSGLKGEWAKYDEYHTLITEDPVLDVPGRVVLASSASEPGRIYAAIASGYKNNANGFHDYFGTYILRSDDNGQTWSQKNIPDEIPAGYPSWANIAWHAMTIAVDPNNGDRVYAGGLNVHKSADGGQTWTLIGKGIPEDWITFVHVDEHAIVFQPGSSENMIVATDGGLFHSGDVNDPQPSFTEINRDYNTLQAYTCAIGPDTTSEHYILGTQDDGTLYYTGEPLTMDCMLTGGDGAFCFFNEATNDPLIVSAFFNSYFFYPDGVFTQYADFKWTGIFINPADYDYLNHTLYANAVTFEQGFPGCIVVITGIPSAPEGQIIDLGTGNTVPFSAVKVSPFSAPGSTTLFLGTQSGRLYRVNGAQTGQGVTSIGSGSFPTANISCIDVGRSENELLLTFSNFGVSSVWHSPDGGQSWMDKEGNLPDIPVRWGLFVPGDSRQVVLATEAGVWHTFDVTSSSVFWEPFSTGIPGVRTDMVRIRKADNMVLAGTHGRGLFTARLPVSSSVPEVEKWYLEVYPNPATERVFIAGKGKWTGEVKIELHDMQGKMVHSEFIASPPKNLKMSVDIRFLSPGIYLITLKDKVGLISEKVVIR